MIDKEEYLKAKKIVDEYESNLIDEQFRFYKIGSDEVERIIRLDNPDLKLEIKNASLLVDKKYVRKFYLHMSSLFLNICLNRVNELGKDAEERALSCRDIIVELINPPKPQMPLCRVIRDGVPNFCSNCGSTESKNGFLGLFGKVVCHNNDCIKSK